MKKIIGFSFVFAFVAAGFYYFNPMKPTTALNERALSLRSSKVTQIQSDSKQTRKPASINPADQQDAKAEMKREWIGARDDIIQSGKIAMKNKPHHNWQDKLVVILERGLNPLTKVEINHERSLVLVNGNEAQNAEQVVVIFNSEMKRNSYRAMVDSQTGKVIRTWDHTIHEDLRKPASLSGLPLTLEVQD